MSALSARKGRREIESEVSTNFGRAQFIRAVWDEPLDFVAQSADHYLQLSLLPQAKNGHVCFPHRWSPQRFAAMGEMFFYPAGQMMHVRATCSTQQSIACTFTPEAAEQFLERPLDWTDTHLLAGLNLRSTAVRDLLFRMGQELRGPGFASDIFVELVAGQLLLELSRHLQNHAATDHRGGLAPWRLRLIEERLRDGETAPTLGELAAICSLSTRHLTRAFRTTTGRSIGAHIAEHRIERAKAMLATCRSVEQVALAAGFRSPGNFSTAFRRVSGETPREFLSRSRTKAS